MSTALAQPVFFLLPDNKSSVAHGFPFLLWLPGSLELHSSCHISLPSSANALFMKFLFHPQDVSLIIWFCEKGHGVCLEGKFKYLWNQGNKTLETGSMWKSWVPVCIFDLNASREADSEQSHWNMYYLSQQILIVHSLCAKHFWGKVIRQTGPLFACFT